MEYRFKLGSELVWAIVVAAILALGQILITLKPEDITNWRLWAVTGAGAVARAVGGAIVGYLTGTAKGGTA